MKVEITAEQDPERLRENLESRFGDASLDADTIVLEIESPGKLEKVPGVRSFTVDGEKREGLHGRPVQEEAYARLESRKDAVKALLATVQGYDLRVLETDREWDLRQLRRYNPSIKHLKFKEPRDVLGIDQALQDEDGLEKIEIDLEDEETELVYREMLT